MRPSLLALGLIGVTCPLLQSNLQADLMSGSTTIASRADQMVRVTDPSPLTGLGIPSGAEFNLSALGSFSFTWDDEVGGTASISSFSASFSEMHPELGTYNLIAVGSGPGAGFTGQLSNIVDAGGSLVSADFSLSTTFSLTFPPPGPGITLYTKNQATFTGVVDGSGSFGNVFASPGDLDIFLSEGDITTDPLSAVSFGRTVTAVPEPSSFLFCGVVGLLVLRRRANGKATREQRTSPK